MAKVKYIFLGTLLCLAPLTIAQTVYSWQDAKGVIHFSQQPPAEGEYQLVTIKVGSGSSAVTTVAQGVSSGAVLDPVLCQQARDQLAMLNSEQELFTKEANQEAVRLLTTEERQQQILLANFEIKRRCPATP